MEKEYLNLRELIQNNLQVPEIQKTLELIEKLKDVKQKGFFTKEQFYEVAIWKSPRPKKHYLNNSEEEIIALSKQALSANSEYKQMLCLTALNGVSIAVASSLLTIINPKDYGIIDIRVWQLLYLYKEVKTNPKGQGFEIEDYENYLQILRNYAKEFNLKVRDIERILFFYHKKIQEGNLYN